MTRISYGMYYEVYGRDEIDLPDDIDPCDEFKVREYLERVKDDLPLPSDAEYVQDSEDIDWGSIIVLKG